MDPKIRIFTLATNNYKIFLESFITSFRQLFLPQLDKEFYIFTDDVDAQILQAPDIKSFFIEHEPWPAITIKRYEYMINSLPKVQGGEICLFADVDLFPVFKVESFSFNKYFGVEHPGNFYVNNIQSLEDNHNSQAYVDVKNIPHTFKYIQGCFWGARGESFSEMISQLYESTKLDRLNNVIAKWHDESHLNKFYINNINDFRIFGPSYAYPENWTIPIPKIFIHRDKSMKEFPRFQGGAV
jgi:hypothetical protein